MRTSAGRIRVTGQLIDATSCGATICGLLAFGGAAAKAQDMPTFLSNLNRQMSIANQNYRAGVAINNSVPFCQKLDYNAPMATCELVGYISNK